MSTVERPVSSEPTAPLPDATQPDLIPRQRTALHELLRLVSERAAAEAEVESTRRNAGETADREYQKARQALAEKFETLKAKCRKEDEDARQAIIDNASAGENQAKSEFSKSSRRIAAEFDNVRETAKNDYARDKAKAASTFDAGERAAAVKFAEDRRPIDEVSKLIGSMHERLGVVFANYSKFGLAEAGRTPTRETTKHEDPVGTIYDRLTKSEPSLTLVEALWIPKSMLGYRYLWFIVILFLILVYPMVLILGGTTGAAVAAVVAIVGGVGLRQWLRKLSKEQVSTHYYPVFQTLIDAESLAGQTLAAAQERMKAQRIQVAKRRDEDLQKAKEKHAKTLATGEETRDERLRQINQVYALKTSEFQTQKTALTREAAEVYERRTVEIRNQNDATAQKLDERYQALKEKVGSRYETSWTQLETRWREGMQQVQAALDGVAREVDEIGPAWDNPSWNDRPFPRRVPPVVRLGDVRIGLDDLPQGMPTDPRLREGVADSFVFPSVIPFPDRANLLIEAPRDGRAAAAALLQAAMLRLLTSLPPGLVRFTIIDPIGIGRNFGAFMHLADIDETLVTNQVWTDPRQIDERLADLAIHMEKVTQKYLRNEYATLGEYNAVAGEVAEPYRVLVIADFPANFDEKSAGRLAAIMAGGVPCGVLALVAFDPDRPLPVGFSIDDLRSHATCLTWNGDRLASPDPDFGRFPLVFDTVPRAELANRLIHRAGVAARDARRVEVSFEFIAPPGDALWAKDSRTGIDVPLGKAGATKRQNLTLGHGTSQHVLIAGRTGSGKSTLLHALITNLALNYSPDEVDLYLIDFKKGVEFKVYATHELPHASVVAIESEREFGISVLQKLDDEMRIRGDLFRDMGVQDVNGYRNLPSAPPLPRAMLIVDEFQEFFVEDDKLAQEAARLLDRLVRQGRAFGVHTLLGSQSLGGAQTLPRTTLGQFAVRVALQCSEADAHLILSENNTAARLLSRPGEAVYNDANGMVEGNHFFQVVWLGDDRREAYLKQLTELTKTRPPALKRSQIVFEGDAPAVLARNPQLASLLSEPAWPDSPRSALAWLGDPVAIKEATAALFRRQGGNHLLIVGQNGQSALGIMASALLGLAAQFAPAGSETTRSGARFALLDGTPEDEPLAGFLPRVAAALPHPVTSGGWSDTTRILSELAGELKRRQEPEADGPEIFLFLADLARFRDLRKRADDFSFSRRDDEDASPADQLGSLLREGPGLGIHVIVWCDNVNNLNRSFDHASLREFEMRVLFQMSQTDSGHLLDAPHASKLGPNRALFFSEEQNRLEKFRPYGLPDDAWLDQIRDVLSRRNSTVTD